MSDWQPIETMPDSGPFLVLSHRGFVGLALVQPWNHGGVDGRAEYAAWVGQKQYESKMTLWMGGEEPSEAKAWMPLPGTDRETLAENETRK